MHLLVIYVMYNMFMIFVEEAKGYAITDEFTSSCYKFFLTSLSLLLDGFILCHSLSLPS